jgi:predicted DNA-binding protein
MKLNFGNWRIGNSPSVVVSDMKVRNTNFVQTRYRNEETDLIYYGGHMVCEGIGNPEYAKLISLAPRLLNACEKFIQNRNSKTMGYYSDEQVEAIEEMEAIVHAFETIEELHDESLELKNAISKVTNNGITLSFSGNKKEHDLIKKHYLGKYEVRQNKFETVDHFLKFLAESFILGAEDDLEKLTSLNK